MPGSIDSGGGQNRGTFAKYLSKVRNGAGAAGGQFEVVCQFKLELVHLSK